MAKLVNLVARITDDGRIFIMAPQDSPDVLGLSHVLEPNDPLGKLIKSTMAMNEKARGQGVKPDRSPVHI